MAAAAVARGVGPRVAVCGGGVVGAAAAFFLARSGRVDPTQVVVYERDPTYRYASTTLSAASIRQQFSTRENTLISQFGVQFLRSIGEYLSVDGVAPDVQLREHGYLFLASALGEGVLRENHRRVTAAGGDVALLRPDELRARFPWLCVDDVVAGTLGLSGEGWFDPFTLLMGFRKKAAALGVRFVHAPVGALRVDGERVTGVWVERAGGAGPELAPCDAFVNAAGPRAAAVARMAGLSIPVEPRRRCVFVFAAEAGPLRGPAPCPLVIDPIGVYFRPEGSGFICGVSPPAERDPAVAYDDFEVDHALFDDLIWPVLAQRVPCFDRIRQAQAWAGHYAYNTFDQNVILGPHPILRNFFFANGFSGHGLQQSPAVGRAIAELVTAGRYETLDLSVFGFERLAAGRPVVELNVV